MRLLLAVLFLSLLISGCQTIDPSISKKNHGNLEINISDDAVNTVNECYAEIYIDDKFIGNATSNRPVVYLKNGDHTIKIKLPGYEEYSRIITIFGEPNHQVLNVKLKKQ